MTEPRALDEPLSDAELDELEGFLASDAVPEDCMDLEMLDGFLAAIVSGPESIQPSEWLPQVWSDGGRSATPAYGNSGDAQRVMALILRHMVGIQRTLAESPTRFKPLLYLPEEKKSEERQPPEGTAWCEGYMAGVKLRDDGWQPLYDAEDARDWIFPIEALAFGDQDPEFAEWIDDKEKRASLVEELAVASVLIYRFWQARRTHASAGQRQPAHALRRGAQVARATALDVRKSREPASRGPQFGPEDTCAESFARPRVAGPDDLVTSPHWHAVKPPSTYRIWPVTNAACGPRKNSTGPLTSSTSAMRPSGMRSIRRR